jgi:hypothetical protein
LVCSLLTAACGTTVHATGSAGAPGALQPSGAVDTAAAPAAGGIADATAPTASGPRAGVFGPTAGSATASSGRGQLPSGLQTAPGAHDPIQIGFITTTLGNAESFGFNTGQSYPDRSAYDALVAEYNAHGGVAGHPIVPVYGETDTASSDFSSQFAAMCATFTQDNHVQAVIGYLVMYVPSFESCLAKAQVPHLYAGCQPGDLVDQEQIPTLIGTAHPTVNGNLLTALEGALRSGLLTASTKLGVMLDTCANGDRAYTRTAEPWLKAHHVDYRTVIIDCADGAGDVSDMAAAVSSAELRFAQEGVNLVFAPGIELLIFMANAESQHYEPDYLGATGGAVIGANAPANQMRRFHGFGWVPAVDVDLRHQPYPQTAAQRACVGKLVKHGLRPAAYSDYMTAYATCDGIELYARALAASGSTQARGVVEGVLAALPSFVGSATYDGDAQATSHQRGGPARYREYGWTDACSCLTYRGRVFAVPNP